MKITRSTVCILKGKGLSIQSVFHHPNGAGFLAQCGSVYTTIVYIIMNLNCSYIPNSGVNPMLVKYQTISGYRIFQSTELRLTVSLISLALFTDFRLCKYFDGQHHLEEIMYYENIPRSQLLILLDKFRSVLVTCQHQDSGIASTMETWNKLHYNICKQCSLKTNALVQGTVIWCLPFGTIFPYKKYMYIGIGLYYITLGFCYNDDQLQLGIPMCEKIQM